MSFDFSDVPDATTSFDKYGGPFTLTFEDSAGTIIATTDVNPKMRSGFDLLGVGRVPCEGKAKYAVSMKESDFIQVDVAGFATETISKDSLATSDYVWNLKVT